jgi:hypothetical protein
MWPVDRKQCAPSNAELSDVVYRAMLADAELAPERQTRRAA